MTLGNIRIRQLEPGDAKKKILNIPLIYQVQSELCWAACATMILRYYGNSNMKKCDLPNFLFKEENCCIRPNSSNCNKPCKWKDIKGIVSQWNIKSVFQEKHVSFSTIISEISAGRPIEIGYDWNFGGSHVVLVIGYEVILHSEYLYINDPARGHGFKLYTDVLSGSGAGSWDYTWIKIQKK